MYRIVTSENRIFFLTLPFLVIFLLVISCVLLPKLGFQTFIGHLCFSFMNCLFSLCSFFSFGTLGSYFMCRVQSSVSQDFYASCQWTV